MSEHAEEKDFGRNPQATETRTFMEYVGGARYEIDSQFLPDRGIVDRKEKTIHRIGGQTQIGERRNHPSGSAAAQV